MSVIVEHYFLPPVVDEERLRRLEDWVVEYTANVRDNWLANGEPVNSPVGREALALVAQSMRCEDIPQWMPLAHAKVALGITLAMHPDSITADEIRSALRTVKSATDAEIDEFLCNQLGVEQLQLDVIKEHVLGAEAGVSGDVETALYRYFDVTGQLLYVGIAANPDERDKQHAKTSNWHRLAKHRSVTWLPSRDAARAAERASISNESPVFNIAGASPRQRRAALDYLFDRLADLEQ